MAVSSEKAEVKIGTAIPRIDAHLKVTGQARYASDTHVPNAAFAVLKTSAIARGRIKTIADKDARAVPGVLDILTYKNIGSIEAGKIFSDGGYMGTTIAPLASDKIQHDGQIVAVILADTFEAANEGAERLEISYTQDTPSAGFGSKGTDTVAAEHVSKTHKDPEVGDAKKAYESAPVKIEAEYATPTQHHNPIELFTTTCAWSNDKLTVWEPSQNVYGVKYGLAKQLGIDADKIHVVSPYVGGAFGSRGSLTQRTALIAIAAKKLNRPVKLVATRSQGFTIASYRAETKQYVKLAADKSGKLVSLTHEGWEISSRPDDYMVGGTEASTRLYACPNVSSKVYIVHADRNTPGFMRSPPELPYLFGLESAMDELAVALNMDPVELRRINDTKVEPIKGLPYTSRSLMKCFDEGAKAFGWDKRNPTPGSMRDGDWIIGWGCATTMYPSQMAPATARVTLSPQGNVKVQTAAHDIGTGAYTVIAMTASDRLGVDLDRIEVELGDSDLPPSPVAGGSNTTASVCNVVSKACDQICDRIVKAALAAPGNPFGGQKPEQISFSGGFITGANAAKEPLETAIARVSNGPVEAYAENMPHDVKPDGIAKLYKGTTEMAGGASMKDRIQFAFGAEFVEVRVHARTREIRCPRVVGAFAAGKIVNPMTAHSQLMGGMIWGISSALHEATEIDQANARYYNNDLAEYLIPVNADIGEVNIIMVPEDDMKVNDMGIKGLGELGNVGTNAAIANAVYHATGVRIRELPVRPEKLLHAPAVST
jgi:xanthine dehydrogenase YagR molybdenum-binding subunit